MLFVAVEALRRALAPEASVGVRRAHRLSRSAEAAYSAVVRPRFFRLEAREPFAGQVEIDLLFHLAVGQVVEELQKHHFEQHQRVPTGPPVVRAVAITDQIPDQTKVHCRRQLAQQMVSWDELFVDHAKEAALAAVFSLYSALPVSRTDCNHPVIIHPLSLKSSGLCNSLFLVNSMGIVIWKAAEERKEEEWCKVIDTNLTGTFLCCREVAKRMISAGGGAMVNIASISAHIVNQLHDQVSYNTSKAGMIHMTRTMAAKWVEDNIRVNTVSPRYTLTEMAQTVPEYREGWRGLIPMKRLCEPEELVGGVIYLVSDAASYTTGHNLVIDGDYTLW